MWIGRRFPGIVTVVALTFIALFLLSCSRHSKASQDIAFTTGVVSGPAAGAGAAAAASASEAAVSGASLGEKLIIPPPMPKRSISPPQDPLPGESVIMRDRDTTYCLFLPSGRELTHDGEATLTIHFHAAIWHAIQEHLRRGLDGPLVCMYPGEGSSIYRRPFEDRDRLNRMIEQVREELIRRGAPSDLQINTIDVSSFSAGYGAVRELVKSPEYVQKIRRIVLCDSMYGSLDEKSTVRRPVAEHIDVWVPFARSAMRKEKTFVVTYSEVATGSYASTSECAGALVEAVGGKLEMVPVGSLPATLDPDFPLRYRYDRGNFHVWGYGGDQGQAHMTHARHLGDIWPLLDAAEKTGR